MMWYSSLIHDSLKAGLPVSLYISKDGYLGVKIDDVEFPYFAWECFEQQAENQEEIDKANDVKMKISKIGRIKK